MGKIPEYKQGRLASNVDLSRISTARRVGDALAGVAQNVANVYEHNKALTRAKENDEISLKAQQLETDALNTYEEHKKTNEKEPVDSFGKYSENYKKKVEAMLGETSSGRVRERLLQSSKLIEGSMKRNVMQWEREQTVTNTGINTKKGLEGVQTEALRGADPMLIDTLAKKGGAFIGNLEGVADNRIVEKTHQDFNKNIAINSFKGMIESGKYTEAEVLLNSKKWDDKLGDDGISKVQGYISSHKRQAIAKKKNIDKLKFTDPWSYLEKLGDVKGNVPLDMDNPSTFANRAEFIDYANKKHKMELPLMPKIEELEFIQRMGSGDVEDNLDKLERLSVAMKPSQYDDFSDQIFKKEKEIGIAMSVINDDRKSAESIITGHRLLKTESMSLGGKADQASVRMYYDEAVGKAIPDQEVRDDTYKAVNAMAVSKAYDRGDTIVSNDDVQNSMNELFGEIQQVNDFNTYSFKINGEFVADLDEAFEELEVDQILNFHKELPKYSNGEVVPHEELTSGGSWLSKTGFHLVVAGDGEYRISDTQGRFLINNEGEPFILNMKGMMKTKPKKIERKPAINRKPVLNRHGVAI